MGPFEFPDQSGWCICCWCPEFMRHICNELFLFFFFPFLASSKSKTLKLDLQQITLTLCTDFEGVQGSVNITHWLFLQKLLSQDYVKICATWKSGQRQPWSLVCRQLMAGLQIALKISIQPYLSVGFFCFRLKIMTHRNLWKTLSDLY